ncbi:PREDICTED: succinate receptor 1 [Elephantulus edwardii]|uniref:succinate receptor 1 n=1 Tax=Elephantulus edwardii TaxID=28737 RepID=UPI0003F0B98E|nr:PREDICTED: succinate receptor 1 [Elephantulus edwardii]
MTLWHSWPRRGFQTPHRLRLQNTEAQTRHTHTWIISPLCLNIPPASKASPTASTQAGPLLGPSLAVTAGWLRRPLILIPSQSVWNSTCKNWQTATTDLEKYYLSIFYTIEFILGILGNTVVVFGYLFCLKNWNSSNVYLFNLSISDLAFLCTLPMLIRSYANEDWLYGRVLCISNRYVLHANLYTSILFLTFISIDRYLLMKHPFRQHLLQKKEFAIFISLAIWVLVTLQLLPMLNFINSFKLDNRTYCRDYASSGDPKQSLIFSLCLTFTGFLIPLSMMGFFYFKIAHFLKQRRRQLTTAMPLERPLNLVTMAVMIFLVLFTPYHIMRNVRIASRLESWNLSHCTKVIIHALYIVTRPLAFLNSAINPVFYFLMGDHFREMLINKLRQQFKLITFCRR